MTREQERILKGKFYPLYLIHNAEAQKQQVEEEEKRPEESSAADQGKRRGRKPGQLAAKARQQANSLSQGFNLQTYIFRVLKEAAPKFGISKKAMIMVNEILVDSYDQFLKESRGLMFMGKKQTLSSRECESSVKLMVPGELGKHAVQEGRKALKKFSGLE